MIVEYIAETKHLYKDRHSKKFTKGKTYEVKADYRNRASLQAVYDSGFVVVDDNGDDNMVSPAEVKIIDNTKGNTFIFEKK